MLAPPAFFFGPGLLGVAAVTALALVLYRAFGGSVRDDPARAIARATLVLVALAASLGAATGVGLLAALGGGTAMAAIAIFAGLMLVTVGFLGGPRWLILPVTVLVLPLAVVSAADIDLTGGAGEREYRPNAVADIRPEYRLGVGRLELDLRDLELPAGQTVVNVSLGMGEAHVLAPAGACVSTEATFGAGAADIPEHAGDGVNFDVDDTESATGQAAAAGQGGHRARAPADRPARGRLRVRGRRADRTLIVAGLATIALGVLLLLDRTGAIDVQFNYMVPAVLAAIGAVLLTAGLSE